jgi:hypothetical protein
MSMCVYSVFVLSCVTCVGLIPRPRSPTDSVRDQETEKRPRSNTRAVETDTQIDGQCRT